MITILLAEDHQIVREALHLLHQILGIVYVKLFSNTHLQGVL